MDQRNAELRKAVLSYMASNGINSLVSAAKKLGIPKSTLGDWIGGISGNSKKVSRIDGGKFDILMSRIENLHNEGGQCIPDPEKKDVICDIASSVLELLPKVELAISDSFNPADREKIRDLADEDGVFRLANRLNRLCGERARKTYK